MDWDDDGDTEHGLFIGSDESYLDGLAASDDPDGTNGCDAGDGGDEGPGACDGCGEPLRPGVPGNSSCDGPDGGYLTYCPACTAGTDT